MLLAALRGLGFEAHDLGVVGDTTTALHDALQGSVRFDVVITSGGVSMGERHHNTATMVDIRFI